MPFASKAALTEVSMTKGATKFTFVENYLVEERTASFLAGEVGLAVSF